MKPHAYLLLTFLVLHARAATIPERVATNFEKKLTEAVKEVLTTEVEQAENVSSEQELIDQANTVQDVENNLRKHVDTVNNIPVKVIIEDQPELKVKGVNEADDDSTEIKRVEIDLKNPGPPQRQQHETQNPAYYADEQQSVASIKQAIKDTQNVFNQGLLGVTHGLQNWFANNEQLSTIQENIQNLQQSFTSQITKLNDTIQGYWTPLNSGTLKSTAEGFETSVTLKNVESGLKSLENQFEDGVKSLTDGVKSLASQKADNATNASSANNTAANPFNPFGGFTQYIQNFQSTIVQGFANVTSAIQNYVNQNQQSNATAANPTGFLQGFGQGIQNIINPQSSTPAGAQSDPANATQRPTIWQGIQSSIQNILRPGQANQPAPGTPNDQPAPVNPIAQAIQNNPFVQGVVNFIQPNKPPASNNQVDAAKPPEKPAEKPSENTPEKPEASADTNKEGSNVVPAAANAPTVSNEQHQKQKPEQQADPGTPAGPIQQIIQRNPIVQGIAGAVQRIQNTITNPEKPRDVIEGSEEGIVSRKHGYHGSGTGSDNNNDSGVDVKREPVKEEEKEQTVLEETKEEDKAKEVQKKAEVVSDKTE